MNNKKFHIAAFILVLLFLSSCKIYFTQEMRDELKANNIPATTLQFYNSRKVLLNRVITEKIANVDTGKLIVKGKIVIEQIKIKRKTPGICIIDTVDYQLTIKFEDGENRQLIFGSGKNAEKGESYVIQALGWDNHVGQTPYDNKMFNIVPPGNDARLKVKRKNYYQGLTIEKRVAKGIRIKK